MSIKRVAHVVKHNTGIDPKHMAAAIKGVRPYLQNLKRYRSQERLTTSVFAFERPFPCLTDRYAAGGTASGAYFYQDLYVAQRIFDSSPERHVDVGSRVDGFAAHVTSFRPIEILDICPVSTKASNILFTSRDIMREESTFDDYTDSLSCLPALQHFGLGHYGDPVDYHGHMRGWEFTGC